MKTSLLVLAVLLGICVSYSAIHLALIEVGQEIVVLHKATGDGTLARTRLWIVEDGEREWLHHGYADSLWIQQLATDPVVTIERDDRSLKYRAEPDLVSDPLVHRLLRDKYGVADRLIRFWAGTDSESGLATRSTCKAVPVRLELL